MPSHAHDPEWDIPPFLREALQGLGRINMGPRGRWARGFGMQGGWGQGPWGSGPKVGRGDVRLAILHLLAEEPMHGYQIMQELSDRSGGMWQPSPGSVYPTLQQLEDEGLIATAESSGKRVFELTEDGHEYLAGLRQPAPWERFSGGGHEDLIGLRDAAFQLGAALIQVATSGDPHQVAAATDVIADAKDRVYDLLKQTD